MDAGTYELTVTDANGCEASIDGGVEITEPETISLDLSGVADVRCNGESNGSIDLIVSGGTAPYTYSWSDGSTTEDLNEVPAGTYSVTVTDANGCIAEASTTVSEPLSLRMYYRWRERCKLFWRE